MPRPVSLHPLPELACAPYGTPFGVLHTNMGSLRENNLHPPSPPPMARSLNSLPHLENDNLRQEYVSLYGHVQKSIPFARIALRRPPEAINLWIGNSHSATALHRDNYENVYVQILGQKHFVLLPPLCQPCVNEQLLRPYTYKRCKDGAGLELSPDCPDEDSADLTVENGAIPFATWDPDSPEENTTPYSALASPMRVTLNPGDMLYLPAMWYHKVSQSCLDDDICVAVNYW